jgi:predicted phage terminase large subunit-like protein
MAVNPTNKDAFEKALLLQQLQKLDEILAPALQEEAMEKAKNSFKAFFVQSWKYIEPGVSFIDSWHIDAICSHLEAIITGEIQNLIIQIAPRHAKSTIVSVAFPAYFWLHNPSEKFITASAIEKLVLRDAVRTRRLLNTDWYKSLNPDLSLLPDVNQKSRYENNFSGYRYATSISAGVTGEGFDTLICLPYYQTVDTNKGRLQIGDIVEKKLDVEVKTFNHKTGEVEWAGIDRFEKNPRLERKLYRVKTNLGEFVATEDHPVFVEDSNTGEGCYTCIKDTDAGDTVYTNGLQRKETSSLSRVWKRFFNKKQPLLLKSVCNEMHRSVKNCGSNVLKLWQTIRKNEKGCETVKESFLQSQMFGRISEKDEAVQQSSNLYLCKSELSEGCRDNTVLCKKEKILFSSMLRGSKSHSFRYKLSRMRNFISSVDSSRQILLDGLQKLSSLEKDAGRREQQLHSWGMCWKIQEKRALSSGIWQDNQGAGEGFIQPQVSTLRNDRDRAWNETSCSSYRSQQEKQLSRKFCSFVSLLSRKITRVKNKTVNETGITKAIITEVSPIHEQPEFVYNIATRNHNYFCAGILVHNCDDLVKAQDSNSRAVIESTLEWWTQAISTRRNSPNSKRILIMQRLSTNDPIGFELENNPDIWTNLCLPTEFEPERKCYTDLGWEDPRTKPGEILWPERFPPKEIKNLKKTLGSVGWAAQYQQNPVPLAGNIIKKDWIQYYTQPYNKFQSGQFELMIGAWDLTFTDTGSSYTVGQVWGKKANKKYLIHQYRAKMDVVEQLAAIRQMKKDYPAIRAILVEERANGHAVLTMLKKEIQGLIPINPKEIGAGDKETRLAACSIEFEAGNVLFPHKTVAPWILDVVEELTTFPKAPNDDICDTCSMTLNWFASKSGLSSINMEFSADEVRKEMNEEFLFGIGDPLHKATYSPRLRNQYGDSKNDKAPENVIITEASPLSIKDARNIFS